MLTKISTLLSRIESSHGVRIVYACESGSRAWGFASPDSDYDIRFIFVRPEESYVSLQEGLESIDLPLEGELDAGGWDIRKAARLLGKSNGALIEWLHSPIIYRNEDGFRERWQAMARGTFSPRASSDHYRGLAKQMVLGKLRDDTRPRKKEIVNPQPEKRLGLLDFCYVPQGQGSVPVLDWLSARNLDHRECGITSVQHAAGMFAIYHALGADYRGLVSLKDPDALVFSSVPKEAEPVGWMQFNQDAFRAHCKSHREYWEWVGQRNEERFTTNAQHGRAAMIPRTSCIRFGC